MKTSSTSFHAVLLLASCETLVKVSTSFAGCSAPFTEVCGVRLIAPVIAFFCEMAVTTFDPVTLCMARYIGQYDKAARMQPAIMIFLRPNRSDNDPNKTKNGIPRSSA